MEFYIAGMPLQSLAIKGQIHCQWKVGSVSKSVVRDVSLTVSDWGRKSMNILHPCYLGLQGLASLHGIPVATMPGLAWLSSGSESPAAGNESVNI